MVSELAWQPKTAAPSSKPAAPKAANGLPLSNRPFALSRRRRLLASGAFRKVFSDGRKYRHWGFDAFIASNQHNNARLGITVAKRYLARAVDRNKIKRLIRESYRQHAALLPPVDIVIRVSSARVLENLPSFRQHLTTLWGALTNPKKDSTL